MIKYFFKTAWRNITRDRTYLFTNVIGLTVGLLSFMLLTSLLSNELSFDRQWLHTDELFRLRSIFHDADGEERFKSETAPAGLAKALKRDLAEIKEETHVLLHEQVLLLDAQTKATANLNLLITDSTFFNLFETEALSGNPKQTVGHMKNLILTSSAYKRYFGEKDVVGQTYETLPFEGEAETYYVSAVIADIPQNSHLHADAILLEPNSANFIPAKHYTPQMQYIMVAKGSDILALNNKINTWYNSKNPDGEFENSSFFLQSIKDIHLGTETGWNSPMRDIYLLAAISFLIIMLISFNYINLNFSQALKHSANTGVRKVLGATRKHIYLQSAAESILFFGLTLVLALGAYLLSLPVFESYLGYPLTMTFTNSFRMLISLIGIWFTIALLISTLPASSLAKTKVTTALEKKLTILSLPLKMGVTRFLVVFQFAVALIIACSMLAMRAQLNYIEDKNLGYNPKNLLLIDFSNWEGQAKRFKETLLQHPSIAAASYSQWALFGGSVDFEKVKSPITNSEETFAKFVADFDLPQTLQLDLKKGRYLQPNYAMDSWVFDPEASQESVRSNVLLTEGILNNLNLKVDEGSPLKQHNPVGVLSDLHGASLHYPSLGMMISAQSDWNQGCLLIRVNEGKEQEAKMVIAETYKTFFPNRTLEVKQVEKLVNQQYIKEKKQYQQLAFFSSISLFIALLGVFGLAAFTVHQRVKEIGIRRVLGASLLTVIRLISNSFLRLVIISFTLAFPIAWWFSGKWLDNFAYRIAIPYLTFILAGISVLILTLIVVSTKALKTAKANPVDSLRDE